MKDPPRHYQKSLFPSSYLWALFKFIFIIIVSKLALTSFQHYPTCMRKTQPGQCQLILQLIYIASLRFDCIISSALNIMLSIQFRNRCGGRSSGRCGRPCVGHSSSSVYSSQVYIYTYFFLIWLLI